MRYPVVEHVNTVQGEGAWAGYPVTLLRLAGCHRHCSFCDTKRAWEVPPPTLWKTIEDLDVKNSCDVWLITGGEPLLYNLFPLVEYLHGKGKAVHVETTGEFDSDISFDWVSISPKKGGEICLRKFHEVKWLVPYWKEDEIDWKLYPRIHVPIFRVYVQPVNLDLKLDAENVKLAIELVKHAPVRVGVSIQLHKCLSSLLTTKGKPPYVP